MTACTAPPPLVALDLDRFRELVNDVLDTWSRRQSEGLCALPGRALSYTLVGLPDDKNLRETLGRQLCDGCPVYLQCGIYGLATTPSDALVASVPYTGHYMQRRKIARNIGATDAQLAELRRIAG